jgi:hypothetical protein
MNKDALHKTLKSAVWVAFPGALISLLACTLLLGSGIFEMLMPVLLTVVFAVISIVIAYIPYTAKRLWLKIAISVVAVTATVIYLCFF